MFSLDLVSLADQAFKFCRIKVVSSSSLQLLNSLTDRLIIQQLLVLKSTSLAGTLEPVISLKIGLPGLLGVAPLLSHGHVVDGDLLALVDDIIGHQMLFT